MQTLYPTLFFDINNYVGHCAVLKMDQSSSLKWLCSLVTKKVYKSNDVKRHGTYKDVIPIKKRLLDTILKCKVLLVYVQGIDFLLLHLCSQWCVRISSIIRVFSQIMNSLRHALFCSGSKIRHI